MSTVGMDSAVDLPGFPTLMPTLYKNPDLNLNPWIPTCCCLQENEQKAQSAVKCHSQQKVCWVEQSRQWKGIEEGCYCRAIDDTMGYQQCPKIVIVLLSLDFWWDYFYHPHFTLIYPSSTAQGGGGSFKDRKPIGEMSCCDSWIAERTDGPKGGWHSESLSVSLSLSLYLSLCLLISMSLYLYFCLYVW